MAKYLLQLEDRGEFVGEHETLQQAMQGAVDAGYAAEWQDRIPGEDVSLAGAFEGSTHPYPVAVAYPSAERTLWIWYDPTTD